MLRFWNILLFQCGTKKGLSNFFHEKYPMMGLFLSHFEKKFHAGPEKPFWLNFHQTPYVSTKSYGFIKWHFSIENSFVKFFNMTFVKCTDSILQLCQRFIHSNFLSFIIQTMEREAASCSKWARREGERAQPGIHPPNAPASTQMLESQEVSTLCSALVVCCPFFRAHGKITTEPLSSWHFLYDYIQENLLHTNSPKTTKWLTKQLYHLFLLKKSVSLILSLFCPVVWGWRLYGNRMDYAVHWGVYIGQN